MTNHKITTYLAFVSCPLTLGGFLGIVAATSRRGEDLIVSKSGRAVTSHENQPPPPPPPPLLSPLIVTRSSNNVVEVEDRT